MMTINQSLHCRRLHLRNILAVTVLLSCMQVAAEDEEYLNMELEQLLQVPVTGSTLRDQSLKSVPAVVSVYTHEQLERMGIDYLYELVNTVPAFQFDRGGDSGLNYTFSSRGRRNGSQAREVLVVIDGRSVANPRTGSADITLPLIPLEQIERVEIIRGPGSAIYGSSAFTGVINIITRKNINAVKLEVGSDDRCSASLSLSNAIGDWSADVYARAYEDSGQTYNVQDTFTKAPLTTKDPRQTIDLDISLANADTKIHVGYHTSNADDFYTIENTQNGFNTAGAVLKQFNIEHSFQFWNNIVTNVYAGYLSSEQSSNVAVIGVGGLAQISQPSSTAPLLTKATLAGETYNFGMTNNMKLGERSNALLGIEWKQDSETDAFVRNNYDLGQLAQHNLPINYYGDFTHTTPLGLMDSYHSVGVYGQYQQALGANTDLTLGLRYDDYDNFGGHLSPRVGLVHQLTPSQTIKLLYGDAYRTPSLGETGVINNPLLVGNPKLSYETVKTWDLLWIGSWGNTVMSVGGFRNDYKDPIVAGFLGSTRTFVNSRDESSTGVTFGAKYILTQQWSLRGIYTDFISLPKTAFREAKQLTSVELNFNQGAWNWNLLANHQSARYELGANNSLNELDDFWVINSKLRYQFKQGYNLSVQFKNLADLDYSTPAQGVNLPKGIPNRGREISLMFDWSL